MKIGLDLDGTLYAHPKFFSAMIDAMSEKGHTFHCISSHSKQQFRDHDYQKLKDLGINSDLIDPSLMYHMQHGDLNIKGQAASQCDIVFDDDVRLAQYTKTPVLSPIAQF